MSDDHGKWGWIALAIIIASMAACQAVTAVSYAPECVASADAAKEKE